MKTTFILYIFIITLYAVRGIFFIIYVRFLNFGPKFHFVLFFLQYFPEIRGN